RWFAVAAPCPAEKASVGSKQNENKRTPRKQSRSTRGSALGASWRTGRRQYYVRRSICSGVVVVVLERARANRQHGDTGTKCNGTCLAASRSSAQQMLDGIVEFYMC